MLWGDGDDAARPPIMPTCAVDQVVYTVQTGDSCWEIADARGMSVKQLEGMNSGVNCARLQIGEKLCVM
jgi:LysM repeat protein